MEQSRRCVCGHPESRHFKGGLCDFGEPCAESCSCQRFTALAELMVAFAYEAGQGYALINDWKQAAETFLKDRGL